MPLPYAFGPVRKREGARRVKYYIMPYAFGLEKDGTPDAEARVRLDKALAVTREQGGHVDPFIYLGAGMEERARLRGVESLAASAQAYLELKNWSKDQTVIYPNGCNTVTETLGFFEYVTVDDYDKDSDYIAEATTSWWHAPRARMVCRLLFGGSVKVHSAPSTHRGFDLLYGIMREVAAFPLSAFHAWHLAREMRLYPQLRGQRK